jgi:hypothetical protein
VVSLVVVVVVGCVSVLVGGVLEVVVCDSVVVGVSEVVC